MPKDPNASVIASDAEPGTEPLSWDEVRQRFDAERWYWVATAGRDGRPHVRPVLAVWVRDKIYSTTGPGARKGRHLRARRRGLRRLAGDHLVALLLRKAHVQFVPCLLLDVPSL